MSDHEVHEDVPLPWFLSLPESKFAEALPQLPAGPIDLATSKCYVCGLETNLWLNLSDGFIGCGRSQSDGSGGNQHSLKHFDDTDHIYPLVVRVGTLSSTGAEVFSYAEDVMVRVFRCVSL